MKRILLGYDGSDYANHALASAAELAQRYGVELHVLAVADHIVVGHRGHTLFERWLIGSVARQVIAYAPGAVTVVR